MTDRGREMGLAFYNNSCRFFYYMARLVGGEVHRNATYSICVKPVYTTDV